MTTYHIHRNIMTASTDTTMRAIGRLIERNQYSVEMTAAEKDAALVALVAEFGSEVLDTITASRNW